MQHPERDAQALPAPAPVDVAWRLPPRLVLGGAVLVALLMSTEYLFQRFVWRYWPWDEVLSGWVDVARDRLVVALAMALALLAVTRWRVRSLRARSALLAMAIVAGAAAGEALLQLAGLPGALGDAPAVLGRIARWSVVAGAVGAMWYLWRRDVEARAAEQAVLLRRLQSQRQASELQLQALRSQIEPHFLFNTLATVRRLRRVEPADGARLLAHFMHYLRTAQSDGRATLGREIDLVRAYLEVVAIRMAGQLTLHFEVPEALREHPCPPLTVATLVENAVKHGIEPALAGGSIRVSACRAGAAIEIEVADTGVGLQGSGGSGIGLANIRARLRTLYGDQGWLSLQGVQPHGVRAVLHLPSPSGRAAP